MYGFNHNLLNKKNTLTTLFISLSYLLLNLRTYSKFNLIPLFIKTHKSHTLTFDSGEHLVNKKLKLIWITIF